MIWQTLTVAVLSYAVASAIVLAAVVPLALHGERFPVVTVARWTGWVAVLFVAAAFVKAAA